MMDINLLKTITVRDVVDRSAAVDTETFKAETRS